jgi:hypothetical protein
LRPRVDLNLLCKSLRQLNDSTYFEKRLHEFTSHLVGSIEHVLDNPGKYDPAIEEQFANVVRFVHAYLSGSTTNEIPHEVVFCLSNALHAWNQGDAVVVTQLTEGHDFHLRPVDPWNFIQSTLVDYDSGGFKLPIVMIGVPKLYAHKPLFCIPLYHELGHFIDFQYSLSNVTALLHPARLTHISCNELSHRAEFFADLFASAFVGRSSISALEAIASGAPTSVTHPSTQARAAVVDAFLSQSPHPVIDLFQSALSARGLPPLTPVFQTVDVTAPFKDLRTFIPNDISGVHGLFDSAWKFMFDAIDQKSNPWGLASVTDGDVERITNDLVEKSIRNFALRSKWNDIDPA